MHRQQRAYTRRILLVPSRGGPFETPLCIKRLKLCAVPGKTICSTTEGGFERETFRIRFLTSLAFNPYWINAKLEITVFIKQVKPCADSRESSIIQGSAAYLYKRVEFINPVL